MSFMEIAKYGLQLLGISFVLWMAAYQTIRFLKSKGIVKTKKITKGSWKKKETQENEKEIINL